MTFTISYTFIHLFRIKESIFWKYLFCQDTRKHDKIWALTIYSMRISPNYNLLSWPAPSDCNCKTSHWSTWEENSCLFVESFGDSLLEQISCGIIIIYIITYFCFAHGFEHTFRRFRKYIASEIYQLFFLHFKRFILIV